VIINKYADAPKELFRALVLMLMVSDADELPPRKEMTRLRLQWLRGGDDGAANPIFRA
jgi:hypothetical protein